MTRSWHTGRGTVVAVALAAAALFFAMEHLPDASTRPDYAPDADTMMENQSRGDLLRRAGLLGTAALAAGGLWLGRNGAPAAGGAYGIVLAAYFGWHFLSVFWSDVPAVTVRRLMSLGILLASAGGVARLLNGRQLVWAVLIAVAAQMGVGVLVELGLGTFRPWRGDYRFAGTIHPNIQAVQLSFGAVAATALLMRPGGAGPRWDRLRFPLLLGAAGALTAFCVLTKSRTSLAGLLAGVAAVAWFLAAGPTKALVGLVGGSAVAAVTVLLMLTGLDPTDEARDAALMGRGGQSGTLTGRLEIWEALDPYVAARPVLGYGYSCFWSEQRVYALHSDVDFKFSASHSAWYETILGLGVPGVLLFAAVLAGGVWRCGSVAARPARRSADGPPDPLPACVLGLLVVTALNSLLEAIMVDPRLTTVLLYAGLFKLTFLPDPPATPAVGDRRTPRPAAGGADVG